MIENNFCWLIITDLDGTLLDHHSYDFSPAKATLSLLAQLDIPVIINSSKTYAEISDIKQSMGLDTPCIVENGSAIIYDHEQIVLGEHRSTILEKLNTLPEQLKSKFRGFYDCSNEEIALMTGLDLLQAKKANKRQYSEPILWKGSETDKQLFISLLKTLDIHILIGGRFMHLLGATDKGIASTIIKEHYQKKWDTPVKTLGLGDSQNDKAMLEQCDVAAIIKNPASTPPAINRSYQSTLTGPAGWAEAIQHFITGNHHG